MGERLAQGNAAVALLANSIATGSGLYVLIVIFGPISGAHFNPVVSGLSVWDGRLSGYSGFVYALAQVSGAFAGVAAAHAMFGLPIIQISAHTRPTLGEGFGEVVATFGLVLVIALASRFRADAIPSCGCGFYYQRVLVYVLYFICKSCRNICASNDRYLRWNLSRKRAAIFLRPTYWRHNSHTVHPLAASWKRCHWLIRFLNSGQGSVGRFRLRLRSHKMFAAPSNGSYFNRPFPE